MIDRPYIEQMPSPDFKPVEDRRLTNKMSMLLLPINLLLWLGFGIYYISTIPNMIYIFTHKDIPWLVIAIFGTTTIFFIILSTFILNQWKNKIVLAIMFYIAIISASMILLIFSKLFELIHLIWNLFKSENTPEYSLFWLIVPLILSVVCLTYYLTIFIRTKGVHRPLLTQMISEPSRAILGSLSTLLFSITIVTFSTMFIMLNFNWFLLHTLNNSERSFWYWLCALLFAFVQTFLGNFIWNFGLTVMGDYFAHYYSSSGIRKETHVLQSIRRMTRYHFGTIAFLSTPILPPVYALVAAFKTNHEHGEQSGFTIITNFFSRVCLVMDISDYAPLQTSVHGHSALKSIKKMFELRQSNSVLFLVTNAASQIIVEISATCASIIGWILGILIYQILSPMGLYSSDDYYDYYTFTPGWRIHMIILGVFVNLMSKFLIRPAMCTYLIHKMTSLRESAALEESCRLHDLPKK